MPYRNLADFLEDLGRAGELAPVDAEVDPCLEIAEITRRVARHDGPALLFRNVKGHDVPLLTNLLGSESRILRALSADSIEEATTRIDRALNSGGGEGWLERLRFGGKSGAAASFAPNRVKTGACQQVVQIGSDVNLCELPLTCQKQPTTPAISSAIMLAADPDSRAQILLRGDLQFAATRDKAIAAWSDVADPSRLIRAYRNLGARMPIAVIVGGDPAMQLAVAAPVPSVVDPLGLAGLLREKPLDVVDCRTIDLLVPSEADIVIEGWIDPAEEGIFSEPMLSPAGRMLEDRLGNTIHVTAVTHRADRVFAAMVPGSYECWRRDRLLAKLFLPYLKSQIPALVDFDLPVSGGSRHLAILAIQKTYPGQSRQIATVAWGTRPFDFARLLIVVDADVNVCDTDQVLAAIMHEANIEDDFWESAAPADPLDPTRGPYDEDSRHRAVDATRDLNDEVHVLDKDVENLVTNRWSEYGLGPESNP